MCIVTCFIFVFFFNDTATTEIYTLSLHDALPICFRQPHVARNDRAEHFVAEVLDQLRRDFVGDRKSTRLNSSHSQISYAVFCLKKKKNKKNKHPYMNNIYNPHY